MKRLQIMGFCLAAVIALGAAVASSASATTPTWFECAKTPKVGRLHSGNYNDKQCTSPNSNETGKYVLREGVEGIRTIKGKSVQAVLNVQSWLGDSKVECAKGRSRLTPLPPNLVVGAEVVLQKCSTDVGGTPKKCTSALRKAGEIKLHALRGELGYVSSSPVVVGVKLGLESEPGGPIANFDCEGLEVTVAGEIVGVQATDVNAVSKHSETVFAAGEYLGELEYQGHQFAPLVNLLGFEDELEAIAKQEAPPNVLSATLCGPLIQAVLGEPCTPPTPAGLDQTIVAKGEALMIKA